MNESVYLGRVGGVRVGMNWSLVPVFFLVAWSLAVGQLPFEAPGYTRSAYWATAVVTGVAFFASLVAHELSHALVARRHGVATRGIVLWLFGGVAQLEGDTPDARAELRVAAAGPALSLALAGVAGAAAWLLGHTGQSPLLVAAVAWLAGVNALLGVFNLLPAFPLDGGRVLRAVLWSHWRDRMRATAVAASAGKVVGYGLVGLGALELLAGGVLGGIWLAMIGWFVATAASQQHEHVSERGRFGALRVSDAMTPEPVVVPATATVGEVVDRCVRPGRFSSYPVGESGRIVGLATVDRIGRIPPEAWPSAAITAAAASPAEMVVCRPDEPLAEAAARLRASADRRAIVVDGGRLVGILTPSDVERAVSHARLLGDREPAGVSWGPAPRS
ncbi:MAG TPA: site-2 protease family protein [Acidimicrobiales bacterium]|nr:site-2 protease family protein [Acidimicrobiales bacterium]